MVFRKTASVTSLGAFTVADDGKITKTAASLTAAGDNARKSYYLDGSGKLDVRGTLSRVAEKYAISDDPSDYIFEAIRANTVNVPNDNHDGFHRDELLRYDTRLKTAVYLTYREKPHHVNHRTDNPKTSRGVILDSHYNDLSPALSVCPTKGCGLRTAERHNRDASGIHCVGCGSTVKDEFVEILVAIDTKKDPVFAEGVRTGQLKAGSMGCNCTSTVCNVCRHVAHSRSEFCDHIRSGNKGTLWTRSAGKWRKVSNSDANREFGLRGLKFDTADLVSLRAAKDGFEVRKAFEYCAGVEFDEYSRVDQPADPKALQRAVLSKSAGADHEPTQAELLMESEQMIARARRRQRRAAGKVAMKFYVVRVDGDPMDTYAAETLERAIEIAQPDASSRVEFTEVEAEDAGAARLMPNDDSEWKGAQGMASEAGDVTINIDTEGPGGEPSVETSDEGLEPEQTMEDFTEDELLAPEEDLGGEPGEEMSPEELGVIPPGAAKEATTKKPDLQRSANMSTFADAYRGWKVQVSPQGNAQLVTAQDRPVLLFTAAAAPTSDADRTAFGREILGHLHEHGLFKTADRYDALYHAKFAQVVDHAMDDMAPFSDKQTKADVAGGGDNDMAGIDRGDAPDSALSDNEEDMADAKSQKVEDSQQDRSTDMEEAADGAPDSSLSDHGSDMRDDPRKNIDVGSNSVLDDEQHDHKERLAALVGARVIRRDAAKASQDNAWLVSGFDKSAQKFVLTNKDLETRTVLGDELMKQWMQLDRAPTSNDGVRTATKYEERLRKAYTAKLEEAKRTYEEQRKADRLQAVEDYQRAVRIVARRHALNLEISPLKESLGVTLANGKTAGYDTLTGAPLDYVPIPGELAIHLVEAAWKDGGEAEVARLLNRAAELMAKSSEYLKDTEEELSKMAHKIPPVTAASMVSDVDREAAETRRRASAGNMELASQGELDVATPTRGNHRETIQAALSGGTRVGALTGQYRR